MKFLSFFALFRVLQYRSYYHTVSSYLSLHSSVINCIDIMEDDIKITMNNDDDDSRSKLSSSVLDNITIKDNSMNVVGTSGIIDGGINGDVIKDDRINYYDVKDDDNNVMNSSEVLLLPPPINEDPSEKTMKLGEKISMEHLGPIIINTDGSLRRIDNWDKLSKEEQDRSFRLIAARNKKRIEILKQKEQQEYEEQGKIVELKDQH